MNFVVPVVMTVFLMVSDTALSLLFPYAYGETIFSILDGVNIFDIECGPQLSINLGYPLIVSWICNERNSLRLSGSPVDILL